MKASFSAIFHLVERGDPQHPLLHRRHGELRRHDPFGNAYYRSRQRQDRSGARFRAALGDLRRNSRGLDDASRWNGSLHHTVDVPPSEETYQPHPGECPIRQPDRHAAAIRPRGRPLPRSAAPTTGDYQAWSPGSERLHLASLDRQIGPHAFPTPLSRSQPGPFCAPASGRRCCLASAACVIGFTGGPR